MGKNFFLLKIRDYGDRLDALMGDKAQHDVKLDERTIIRERQRVVCVIVLVLVVH